MPGSQHRPFLSSAALMAAVVLLVAATIALGTSPARAQEAPAWTDWSVDAAAPDWRTWVAPEARFGLLLPQGHELAAAGSGLWYLHGRFEGEPTVPDATLRWLPDADLAGALAETFDDTAIAEPWRFGDAATHGLRVLSRRRAPDGTPYTQAGYLIELDHGILRISRYESFDWAPFHAVAESVRRIRLADVEADR